MRNKQRETKICNAILIIGVATCTVYMMGALIFAILDELRGIPEEFILKFAMLGFIPIAILGFSKIAAPHTKC